jgi:subtilisin family serine protease
MDVKTIKNVDIRYGHPSPTAPLKGRIFPGFTLDVSPVEGARVDGNSIWYEDGNGDFLHSSGFAAADSPPLASPPDAGPAVDYRALLGLPEDLRRAGGRGVKVALIDTGIYMGHPDFVGASPPILCSDASGSDLEDGIGHGTCCATFIKALSVVGSGITGLAPLCELKVIKAGHPNLGFTMDMALEGLRQARTWGAQVISMSFQLTEYDHRAMDVELADAANRAFLVASVGDDDGLGSEKRQYYPAVYPVCIAVGAADEASYARLRSSGFAPRVDYLLPGIELWACARPQDGLYTQASGSSIATAIVSGVIAALISAGGLSPGRSGLPGLAASLGRLCVDDLPHFAFQGNELSIMRLG